MMVAEKGPPKVSEQLRSLNDWAQRRLSTCFGRGREPRQPAEVNRGIAIARHDRAVRTGMLPPIPDKRPADMSKAEWKALKATATKPVQKLRKGDIGPTPEQMDKAVFLHGPQRTERGQAVGIAYKRQPWFETLAKREATDARRDGRQPAIGADHLAALRYYRAAFEAANRSEFKCALNQQPRGGGERGDIPPSVAAARWRLGICEARMGGGKDVMRAIALADRTYADVAMERFGSRDRDWWNSSTGLFESRPAPKSNRHPGLIRDEFMLGLAVLLEAVRPMVRTGEA
jgi:hypothetical protein